MHKQARGEVFMASPPGPKKTETAAATAAVVTESGGGDPMDEDAAAGGVVVETPAAGDDSADKDGGDGKAENDGGKEPESNGVESKTAAAAEKNKGDEAAPLEPGGENGEGATSNGKARHGSPEGKKEGEGEEETVDVYRRDMAWLRSAHGMVAEVYESFGFCWIPFVPLLVAIVLCC